MSGKGLFLLRRLCERDDTSGNFPKKRSSVECNWPERSLWRFQSRLVVRVPTHLRMGKLLVRKSPPVFSQAARAWNLGHVLDTQRQIMKITQPRNHLRHGMMSVVHLQSLPNSFAVARSSTRPSLAMSGAAPNTGRASWTEDGFRTSWGRASEKAGVDGRRCHDLRGSAVTRLAKAGCSVPEIAAITGHSPKDADAILATHYLGGRFELAEAAILKLETHEKRTELANHSAN